MDGWIAGWMGVAGMANGPLTGSPAFFLSSSTLPKGAISSAHMTFSVLALPLIDLSVPVN